MLLVSYIQCILCFSLLDVKDENSFPRFRQQLEQEIGETGLHLLINNAGIAIWKDLDNVTKADMMENFEVNTVSPLLLTKVSFCISFFQFCL